LRTFVKIIEGNKNNMQNAAASLEQDSGSSDAVTKVVLKAVTSESSDN
jgi:hypothetical protein